MWGFGGSAFGVAVVSGIVLVGGGGGGGALVGVVGGVVVAGGVVVEVGWLAAFGCDPALAGALLLLPQPAASAAVRSRGRRARPITAA